MRFCRDTVMIALLALAALSTPRLAAQTPADTVRGVVFDSLAGAPLPGALVTANGDGPSAVSDSLGRFELVARTRVTRLVAYHEVLDRLGLGYLVLDRNNEGLWHSRGTVGRGSRTAWLALPGIETVWTRVCKGRRPTEGLGGILLGSTRLANDSVRLGGVQVEVQWESLRRERSGSRDTLPQYESIVVRSDSVGDYVACGVQEFGQAGVTATGAAYRSGNVLVPGDERPLRRQDLVLADTSVRTVLSGFLVDDVGLPVDNATVTVDGTDAAALTGPDGRFRFAAARAGSRMLSARKLGHVPTLEMVDVIERGTRDRTITLPRGIAIEGVKVTARRALSRDRREFDERRRAGFSQVMDSTRLMQFPMLQSALRMYPGLHVRTGRSGFEFALLGRIKGFGQRCSVITWVDGVLADTEFLRVLPLENIAATELFSSDAFAPARYRSFGDTCATLLIWTKGWLQR